MSRMKPPSAEGTLVYERKLTVPVLIAIAGIMLGAGVGYASHTHRVGALETWRAEKERADNGAAVKLDTINERTIRMEEQIKAIAGSLGVLRRP